MTVGLVALACSHAIGIVPHGVASRGAGGGTAAAGAAGSAPEAGQGEAAPPDASPTEAEPADAAGDSSLDAGIGPGSLSCADAGKYIFLFDKSDTLLRFDPTIADPSAITIVGPMQCASDQVVPNSMAVDREGRGWALYGNWVSTPQQYDCAGVFLVDLGDGHCLGKSQVVCGSSGFNAFGMAFVGNPAGLDDTLYLANYVTPSLGKVDLSTGQIANLGTLPGSCELTGDAKGELWGFFPGDWLKKQPAELLELDPSNGQTLSTVPLPQIGALTPDAAAYPFPGASDYATAFWGGYVYVFFYMDGYDSSTNVWKISPSGSVQKYISNTGWHIVGAGVSTCAPVTPS